MEENPKDLAGQKKAPLRYVPPMLMIAASGPMAQGAEKYGPYNWRTGPKIHLSLYLEAIMRHLLMVMDGQDLDKDSGKLHLAHIAATCAVILDAYACGQLVDDRFEGPGALAIEILNEYGYDIKDVDIDTLRKINNPTLKKSKPSPPEDALPLEGVNAP